MRPILVAITLFLAGCAGLPDPVPQRALRADGPPTPQQAVENFVAVVQRVEPVAEQLCRSANPRANCDYQILVDDDPRQPANAFQTVNNRGRPFVVFTVSLIAEVYNQDELAFILGHETAHHIAGHLPRQQESAVRGAVLAGALASLGGADARVIRSAQEFGFGVGARTFSREFELEADRLGTLISLRAGFDPVRGAAYFGRIEEPGNAVLGTHPPNAARIEAVRQTAAQLR